MQPKNLTTMVKEIIDKETADFMKELPRLIRQRLTVASLTVLGLDQSWGGNNVKVSSDGAAFFSSLLTEEVKKQCKKVVPKVAQKALAMVADKKLDQLADNLSDTYYYKLKDIVNKELEKLAEKHGKVICEKMEKHFKVELLDNLDLNDPSSFSGKLGEFALAAVAEDITVGTGRLTNSLKK